MGFSSQSGQIILKTQATPGVLDPDLAANGVGVKLRSGSLGTSRDLLVPDPEIGGGRDVADAYLGAASWSGDYEFYARMESIATMLNAVLGDSSTVTTTGVSVHTITPSDAAQLPFLSIEESIGNGLETFNYTDAVVNTFHLEAEANGYVMGTMGLIAIKQVANASRTATPNWDNTPLLVGTNISVTYGGVTLPAKSFSIDINNNFEDDDYRLGSFYLGDLTPKRREVTASFGIRESDSALWRQATYGINSATQVGGLTTKSALVINMATYETIEGGTPATVASLQLTIPKFILTPYTLEASGDDIIESDVEGQAVRPDPGVDLMTAVVTNGAPTIA